jgi:hypothetical protein
MVVAPFDFVTAVANDRELLVTSAGDHVCRLEPRASDLPWFCDLDDCTPTGVNDLASHVRWVCPALRVRASAGTAAGPVLEVRRPGPQSDLGRLVASPVEGRAARP